MADWIDYVNKIMGARPLDDGNNFRLAGRYRGGQGSFPGRLGASFL
jgi:hypothetical protein